VYRGRQYKTPEAQDIAARKRGAAAGTCEACQKAQPAGFSEFP